MFQAATRGEPYPLKRRLPLSKYLYTWIENKRTKWNRLPQEYQKKLEAIGIRPQIFRYAREKTMNELKTFHRLNRHLRVDRKKDPNLYLRLDTLRIKYREGTLEPQFVKELNRLGMAWNRDQCQWQILLEKLKHLFARGDGFPPPFQEKSICRWYQNCIAGTLRLNASQKKDLRHLKIPIPHNENKRHSPRARTLHRPLTPQGGKVLIKPVVPGETSNQYTVWN